MYVLALRDVVNFPLLERRISVHTRDALAALKAPVTYRLLVSACHLGGPTWIACRLLLL